MEQQTEIKKETPAPETGKPKDEKPKKELTPQQLQQRKKLFIYPAMILAFAGCMYLIFAPSTKDDKRDEVSGFNADIPMPTGDGMIDDKQTAYEQQQMDDKQKEKVRSLEDFAFTVGGEEAAEDDLNLMDDSEEKENKDGSSRGNSSIKSSAIAYQDMNRQLGSFYETPKEDKEKEALAKKVEELTAQLTAQNNPNIGIDDQVALMEKSYELAAKYMGGNGQTGQMAQVSPTAPVPVSPSSATVKAVSEKTVSGLHQPMSDADFMRAYSKPRNYGFNTAVGSGYSMGKNTIKACVHQDQTLTDGQTAKLRLLEPLQAGDMVVPKNTLISGTAKVQGERLDILVSSIEYAGNIIPVDLAVYDSDGQKGLFVPSSMEQEAIKEAMANVGAGLGSSVSFTQSAGQQIAMDLTRGVMQGGSQYLAKKFRTVQVHLKANYQLMLFAKQQ